MMREILRYQTDEGRRPFEEWFLSLRDLTLRNRIDARLDRLRFGNFGDSKTVGGGIWELRVHFGSGYRIYLGLDGASIVILLCGGDKSSQDRDIRRAQDFWRDYLKRR